MTGTASDTKAGDNIVAVVVEGGSCDTVYQGLTAWTEPHSPRNIGGQIDGAVHLGRSRRYCSSLRHMAETEISRAIDIIGKAFGRHYNSRRICQDNALVLPRPNHPVAVLNRQPVTCGPQHSDHLLARKLI
ncbi:MAG TPA: hypothetical protein VFX16_33195 [Pseudonocardiaceae bacterium]|nr:hypothetical protein [Pseudonocardiaceae bacterium]